MTDLSGRVLRRPEMLALCVIDIELEHVLSHRQPARWLMQRLNGIMRTFDGANLNRDTVANVELAGFDLVDMRDLWGDIVKLIVAERAV